MKVIPRSHTRKIQAIKDKNLVCTVYSESDDFKGREVDPKYAWEALRQYTFARLRDYEDGKRWVVRVHGNLWYDLAVCQTPDDLPSSPDV